MQPTLAPAPHPMQTSAQVSSFLSRFVIRSQNPLSCCVIRGDLISFIVVAVVSSVAHVGHDGDQPLASVIDFRVFCRSHRQLSFNHDHADQVLHDQLLAAHQHLSHPQQARPQPPAPQPPHMQPNTPARDQNNIDPAISGATMLTGPPQTPTQPDVTGQETPKTYGKRPLSTSKRAAQNRAAQRAFRQRKEAHIRELEAKVKSYENMGEAIKALQAENYQLRERGSGAAWQHRPESTAG
ncbi:hypothetical protein CNMCM6106_002063 [Aspergillus hiratsukae]|uniref:Putative transcription factor kapC n=1 Tax=Aspergillus hiratsukae TaxID=1194566 RepID=A0A8H6UU68_9EURO|nr:hypothetical protein CNMCM6106_002063 [Aspergillus hiratsukae]